MLCIVARRLTIVGVSQRVVGDPSKPVETMPRRWLGRGRPSKRSAMSPAARIGPSGTHGERSLTGPRTRLEARMRRQPCRRAASGGPAPESAPQTQPGPVPKASPRERRHVSELFAQHAATMSTCSGRGDRRPALRRARNKAPAMAERVRVRTRSRTRDQPSVVTVGLRSAAGPSRWYLNCPCFGLTITPTARRRGDRAMSTVPSAHQHDGRAVQLPATRGCALRRRLATQRRRCPRPRATAATTMRNATAIAEVQYALGVARIGSSATASHQRRAAQLGIELRRARILTLVSTRLTASRSPLAVDGQAASRPSMAARASASPRRPPKRGTARDAKTPCPGELEPISQRTGRRDERERDPPDRPRPSERQPDTLYEQRPERARGDRPCGEGDRCRAA